MAKITTLAHAMEKQDRDRYQQGLDADIDKKNPHDASVSLRHYQAWSAGHFDKWGRV